MKRILGLLAGAIAAIAPTPPSTAERRVDVQDSAYEDLRSQALAAKPGDFGIPAGASAAFGVLMEMDVDGVTATIVAFSTGDASLYFSSGGGTIGGGAHERVANAARALVAKANTAVGAMEGVSTFPRPGRGETVFYVLTPGGVFRARGETEALAEGRGALAGLFEAGQEVLTQFRLVESAD